MHCYCYAQAPVQQVRSAGIPQLGPRLSHTQGISWAEFSSKGSAEESTSKLTVSVGRIQFLVVGALKPLCSCWLSSPVAHLHLYIHQWRTSLVSNLSHTSNLFLQKESSPLRNEVRHTKNNLPFLKSTLL